MGLRFEAWPLELVTRYVDAFLALAEGGPTLIEEQFSIVRKTAVAVDLGGWSEAEVDGFFKAVLVRAGLSVVARAQVSIPLNLPPSTAAPTRSEDGTEQGVHTPAGLQRFQRFLRAPVVQPKGKTEPGQVGSAASEEALQALRERLVRGENSPRHSDALDGSEAPLAVARRLADDQPDNLQAQFDLSVLLSELSNSLRTQDPPRARELSEEALAISRRLELKVRRYLLGALSSVADILEEEDPDRALELFDESLTVARRLVDAQPVDLLAQRDLCLALEDLALALWRQDPRRAGRLFNESLAISRALVDAGEGPDPERELWSSLRGIAEVVEERDPDWALELLEEALNWTYKLDTVLVEEWIAVLDSVASRVQGTDPERALVLFDQSLVSVRGQAEARPGDVVAQSRLGISLERVGKLVQESDPRRAMALFEELLALTRRMAADWPSRSEIQRNVAVALCHLAGLGASQGVNSDYTWADVCRELRSLARTHPLSPADAEILEYARRQAGEMP